MILAGRVLLRRTLCACCLAVNMNTHTPIAHADDLNAIEQKIIQLLEQMTTAEKAGQMSQLQSPGTPVPDSFKAAIRAGRVGSVINEVDVGTVNELQRIAVEKSRLSIPLLIGRDVIHGFRTVLPIPLGQAATWNPDIVRQGARVAAEEASAAGINWTFAPMVDISRDPRWGRIAESFGEDPHLASELGVAMVEGFQGEDLAAESAIAACAKHFAGYGAAESGRDYATTNIPENEMRNVYLRPFKAAVENGVATLMTSFSDIDGIPATANEFLVRKVLRGEWSFDGLVVSDWDSVRQLQVHGIAENDAESAYLAIAAGVDMEMAGDAYVDNIPDLVEAGRIDSNSIDAMVANILRAKFRLGLFDNPYRKPDERSAASSERALETARQAALQSIVLLKNDNSALPLRREGLTSIAVIGPMADAPYEQLGTWIFDGDPETSVTPLAAIREAAAGDFEVRYVRALETTRSRDETSFVDAVEAAKQSDAVLLFLGEESILSGEAHSRADIDLPGAQAELVRRVRAIGKPVIAVILAGRPLTLSNIIDEVDAILFAWHPGTMGGPAIADLLLGVESPSGKLPVTFPSVVGQIPIYYNQKNTGKPPTPESVVHIDDINAQAPQTSLGMTAFHLDAGYLPLFPFGHGLSYTRFEYGQLRLSDTDIGPGGSLTVTVDVSNTGDTAAEEVVQLYVRDLVGSVTRPVRELKRFRRVAIEPGQTITVDFELRIEDLAFYGRDMKFRTEPGDFHVWVGGSSTAELRSEFRVSGEH